MYGEKGHGKEACRRHLYVVRRKNGIYERRVIYRELYKHKNFGSSPQKTTLSGISWVTRNNCPWKHMQGMKGFTV